MTTEQALALIPRTERNGAQMTRPEGNLGELMQAGAILAKSGFFPDTKQESQAVAKVLAGAELGIGPVASLRGIDVIEGELAISANLIAALIKRSRPLYDYRILDQTDQCCEIAFYERGAEVGRSAFTLDDAKRANLAGKQNWQRYPVDMLFSRAISRGGRRFCADLFIGGVYTPEELSSGEAPETPVRSPASVSDLYDTSQGAEPEPPRESDAEMARKRFFAVARDDHGLTTQRAIHEALGLPVEPGALKAWTAVHGWDAARKALEDGQRVVESEPDILDPDPLPFEEPEADQTPFVPDGVAGFPGMEAAAGDPVDTMRKGRR